MLGNEPRPLEHVSTVYQTCMTVPIARYALSSCNILSKTNNQAVLSHLF